MVLARLKIIFFKSVYHTICDDHGVNTDKTEMNGDWFYMTKYDGFCDGGNTTSRSPPSCHTQWIITQSKGFTRKA